MNIATIGILALALMAFQSRQHGDKKPGVDAEGNAISPPPPKQITQGYYTPSIQRSWLDGKRKMGTPDSLGVYRDWVQNKPMDKLIQMEGEYFVLTKVYSTGSSNWVMKSTGRGGVIGVERYNPANYSVE